MAAEELRVILADCVAGLDGKDAPKAEIASLAAFPDLTDLFAEIDCAIVDDPPATLSDGGFVAPGYDTVLDDLNEFKEHGAKKLKDMQAGLRRETGVARLRLRRNNLAGYFVEVPSKAAGTLVEDERFRHVQTLASTMRFKTAALEELDSRLSLALNNSIALELDIFKALVGRVLKRAREIIDLADGLARVDVGTASALIALDRECTRPVLDDSRDLEVIGGRHVVVEDAQEHAGAHFTANDCALADGARQWVVTGPNMGGKSTFLRQVALISVLAQAGMFVPAAAGTRLGVVDRLFSRVGARDELAHDRSTFMVEMLETAHILANATPRSLVIMDEVGRGTATYDGLALAWAVLEHLNAVNRCRALFATHYHELTALSDTLDDVDAYSMAVEQMDDDIVFLYKVQRGIASRSYGVHVARVAGLPPSVTDRAAELLVGFEAGGGAVGKAPRVAAPPATKATPTVVIDQAAADKATEPVAAPLPVSVVSERDAVLEGLDLDAMTPRQALNTLFDLAALAPARLADADPDGTSVSEPEAAEALGGAEAAEVAAEAAAEAADRWPSWDEDPFAAPPAPYGKDSPPFRS